MKKIFLVASVLALFTAGVNAYAGDKHPKKSPGPKAIVQLSTAASDTTHHKKTAMAKKKHYKKTKPAQTKTK